MTPDPFLSSALTRATARLAQLERDLGANFDPSGLNEDDAAHVAALRFADQVQAMRLRAAQAECALLKEHRLHLAECDALTDSIGELVVLLRDIRDRISRRPWRWLLRGAIERIDRWLGSPEEHRQFMSDVMRRIREEERRVS